MSSHVFLPLFARNLRIFCCFPKTPRTSCKSLFTTTMASATPIPVRSRGIKLSSIHTGKRRYPKARPPDLQLSGDFSSGDSISAMLASSSSADTLPEYTSPISPKFHNSHRRLRSLSSLLPSRDGFYPSNSRAVWVLLWFSLNFSLTLSNKFVLNQFPFPYTMTAMHALAGCLGTWLVMSPGDRLPTLSTSEVIVLVSFSALYTLNIIVSNVSLQLVTVPFHQVVRSSAPFFTLVLSALLIKTRFTQSKLISLVPVVAGVGLATYGDYYYTLPGFLLTLLGTVLASLKTVVTNVLQSVPTSVNLSLSHTPDRWEGKDTSPSLHSRSLSISSRPRVRTSQDSEKSSAISVAVSYPPSSSSKYTGHHHTNTRILPSISSIPRLHLTPIQLLHLLSPLAFLQCILLAVYFGEHTKLLSYLYQFTHPSASVSPSSSILGNHTFQGLDASNRALNGTGIGFPGISADAGMGAGVWAVVGSSLPALSGLVLNAAMAFALNVVSFHTNRTVGPLGMSVAANVKQVLTILSSVVLFNLTITGMNALGILLTLIGGAWYASVDLRERGFRFR
ncbi:hypothetical protein D9756_008700 [Leucocoprinus leucothites]|uniref:Sugar phosphate transporter domain-containing protein n=1 Tax=Leucocoprinus leucothites TaxID=201217 RepID=A0A8H5D019_9AGAR|nr:hypothetical protein D9756_008700 [Leucoagaricus leucothites]